MTYPRASSGLLRSRVRPAAARAAAPRRAPVQVRTQTTGAGGPGKPDPKKTVDTEYLKRNWVPIGGAGLLLLGMYAYLTGSPKKTDRQLPKDSAELKRMAKDQKDHIVNKVEEKGGRAMDEMSGKRSNMGGFRNE